MLPLERQSSKSMRHPWQNKKKMKQNLLSVNEFGIAPDSFCYIACPFRSKNSDVSSHQSNAKTTRAHMTSNAHSQR